MGWLFSPPRNPDDPHQLRVAIHELGHAWAWRDGGLQVGAINHRGNDGNCHVRYYPSRRDDLWAFAVGCWAGFVAEDKWARANKHPHAKRGNSSHDIREFRAAVCELGGGLSESKAKNLARRLVDRRWSAIVDTAPRLVTEGRIRL